jgi:hypothetical protein
LRVHLIPFIQVLALLLC